MLDRAHYINQKLSIEFELGILLGRKNPITIFEIGACEGEDSIKYARFFPKATIYAFEPLPDNISLIEANYLKYGIANARIFNKALSDKNGTATFFVSDGRPPDAVDSDWDYGNKSSSLLAPSKHLEAAAFISFDKKIEVETITISTFCKQEKLNDIDFIHMDVQGAELMVLQGAEEFIASIKVIWLEVSIIDYYKDQPLASDVKKFMDKNGFVLLKDDVNGMQGDQMFVSKIFYTRFYIFRISKLILFKSILSRILRKLKLINS